MPAQTQFGLFRLIGQTQVRISVVLEQAFDKAGVDLNYTQFVALKLLGKHGPMTAGELARMLNYNPGALTRLLDKLESQEYLRRTPSPNDRRALQLKLTNEGRAIRKKAMHCANGAAGRVFADVTPEERQQVHDVLARVLEGLYAGDEE